MMRWIVVGGVEEKFVCKCVRNFVNGEIEGSVGLKDRSGCVERGMKCMFEGEGRVRRLERSNVWQKVAVLVGFSAYITPSAQIIPGSLY